MKPPSLYLDPPPAFVRDRRGKSKRVQLEPAAYVTLLVRANVTDAALWPPDLRQGAAWLKRIRAIEAACIRKHGHFDWEKLPSRTQDEYDGLRVDLNRLRDTGEWVELRAFLRKRSRRSG